MKKYVTNEKKRKVVKKTLQMLLFSRPLKSQFILSLYENKVEN